MTKYVVLLGVLLLISPKIDSVNFNKINQKQSKIIFKKETVKEAIKDAVEDNSPRPKIKKESKLRLTIENVYKQLLKHGLSHPNILIKQIRLETGNLKLVRNNNLFGFKGNRYLRFDSWVESIKYYKKWQDERYEGGNYYHFLRKIRYSEDPNYIEKLKEF